MANILDSRDEMSKVDEHGALRSIEQLGSQIKQIWELAQALTIPKDYTGITSVVVAGMGGSAYGAHVITTLFKDQLHVPVVVVPDYSVPAYVDASTLVLVSSYSGSSEETLAAAQDARKKGAKIVGLTSGGKLAEFLKEYEYPTIVFDGAYNPCGVARFGYGYSIFGQMALFSRLGLITLSDEHLALILDVIATEHLRCSADIASDQNPAKLLAFELSGRVPVVTVAEHLEGIAHVVANAYNENAKTFSEYRVIPELNHHLLEGFAYPESLQHAMLFVTVDSTHYERANRNRLKLTEDLFGKFHLEYRRVEVTGKTRLEEAFSLLIVGVYASFYLAMLYGKDPAVTSQVDWFKSELKNL